jgi:hypothetical protein
MAETSKFRKSDSVQDRRNEPHHRPLLRRPEAPFRPWETRSNDLQQLGQLDLEVALIGQEEASRKALENSQLARDAGVLDIGKVTPDYEAARPQSLTDDPRLRDLLAQLLAAGNR